LESSATRVASFRAFARASSTRVSVGPFSLRRAQSACRLAIRASENSLVAGRLACSARRAETMACGDTAWDAVNVSIGGADKMASEALGRTVGYGSPMSFLGAKSMAIRCAETRLLVVTPIDRINMPQRMMSLVLVLRFLNMAPPRVTNT